MTLSEILELKFPRANFQVGDHGQGSGPEIVEWNVLGIDRPTQDQIDQWAIDLELPYRQQQAVNARVYPKLGDQLDMIYKDLKAGTHTFIDTIDAVKAAHPKPTV